MNRPNLRINLLGGVSVIRDGRTVDGFAFRKVEALLAYLACHQRPLSRETLAALLWPDSDQSRALANLSVALSYLRKQLDDYIDSDRYTVALNRELSVWLDVAQFEAALAQARTAGTKRAVSRTVAAQLEKAVALYRGDFLAGFNLRGTPEFEAWMLLEQERLRQLLLSALADLVAFHEERAQWSAGIRYAQQLLAVDSLQEETHRQLMRLFAQNNQRSAALAQYDDCVRVLAEELGVDPDDETTTLYEQIVAGRWPAGAAVSSPPVRASAAPAHNLPALMTPFIGREAEFAHIAAWLAEPASRLLSIVGPGGIGKSRLAQEAARKQVGHFADGVWFVALAPETAFSGLLTAVAEAAGISLANVADVRQTIIDHVRKREMLLILDNFEHLHSEESQAFVSDLVRQSPELKLLVTTRERVNLLAESLLTLGGLPYPADDDSDVSLFDAVQLFVSRARQLKADFGLAGQAAEIGQLCRLVDGWPLALELAAAWTRALSVPEIVAEIERNLDILATTMPDLPPRHRSMRAVFDQTWQLLTAEERELYARLSVFRGGFMQPAAVAVAQASLPLLLGFIDQSLLRRDDSGRFWRHPLLVQFSAEKLAADPAKQQDLFRQHAAYFADLCVELNENLVRAGNESALAAVRRDEQNILAAWRWTLQTGALEFVLPLCEALATYLLQAAQYGNGAALFAEAMTQLSDADFVQEAVVRVHIAYASFAIRTGENARAAVVLQKSLAAARRLEEGGLIALALHRLGINCDYQGQYDEGLGYLQEALALLEELDDPYLLSGTLNSLAIVEWMTGALDSAEKHALRGLHLAEAVGNDYSAAVRRLTLGSIAHDMKAYDRAISYFESARDRFQALGNQHGLGVALHNLANTYGSLGDHERSLAIKQHVRVIEADTGHVWDSAISCVSIAATLVELGRYDEARAEAVAGIRLSGVALPQVTIDGFTSLGRIGAQRGQKAEAVTIFTFATNHAAAAEYQTEQLAALLDALRAEMTPDAFAVAAARAASFTLESLIAHVLGEA